MTLGLQVMPPSSEGRQIFRLGLGTVIVMLLLITAMFAFLAFRLVTHRAQQALERRVADAAALMGNSIDAARLSTLPGAGQTLQACVVTSPPGNAVRVSTLAELNGQKWEAAWSQLQTQWPGVLLARASLPANETLWMAARPPEVWSVLPLALVGLGGSAILGFLLLPFFVRLNHAWFMPFARILEADRTTKTERSGELLTPGNFPSGMVRELVTRRNQKIEALKAKDDALSRRSADMEMLYELSRELGLSREAPDIPGLSLAFLSRSVEYDLGCMLVFNEDQRILAIRSRTPAAEMLLAEIESMAVNAFFERSGILLESETLQVSQQVADVRGTRLEGKVRGAYWVPVTVRNKTVGVMAVLAISERSFSPEAVRMVNIVAQNTSLALEKLQLQRIEETQRFRNVLENLAEGVVLVRQNAEWALATGTARLFHRDICGADASDAAEHSRECPIGLLGLDIFHSGTAITRELTRNDRTFILAGTFVRSSAAGEQGTVIAIRDVTDERATQQKLFQASKLASLGELAAGVAHEVNNPLTGILGFTELLLSRSDLTAPVAESLQEIHALARRTNHITMDLLLFARVQREGGFRAVNMRAVVRDTIKLLETSYRNLKLELVAELGSENERLMALGDQGKIQQIVTNLAQNAKDAITMAGKGGRIVFRGYTQNNEVVLEVEDDGPGIPERIRNKIFEPFFTTKPIGKGTGLGLAIVNRIVEEHKGTLTIDSEEGRGTLFRIVLPVAPPDMEEAAPPSYPLPVVAVKSEERKATDGMQTAPAEEETPAVGIDKSVPKPASGDRATIVVLDDEETVLKFLTRSLETDGIRVHSTTDPEEALRLVAVHRPDLLFCDFRMPEITGEEFYHRMVAEDVKWSRRIVFLTGDTSGDEIQGFLKATGALALSKPIGVRDLRTFVDRKLVELQTPAEAV